MFGFVLCPAFQKAGREAMIGHRNMSNSRAIVYYTNGLRPWERLAPTSQMPLE